MKLNTPLHLFEFSKISMINTYPLNEWLSEQEIKQKTSLGIFLILL